MILGIIALLILLILVTTIVVNIWSSAKTKEVLHTNYGDTFLIGSYVMGHPDVVVPFNEVYIAFRNNNLLMIFALANQVKELGIIPLSSILGVHIEDHSTITTRIQTGIISVTTQSQTNPLHYIVIEWSDGKFTHQTIFSLRKSSSLEKANKVYSRIIAEARKHTNQLPNS